MITKFTTYESNGWSVSDKPAKEFLDTAIKYLNLFNL